MMARVSWVKERIRAAAVMPARLAVVPVLAVLVLAQCGTGPPRVGGGGAYLDPVPWRGTDRPPQGRILERLDAADLGTSFGASARTVERLVYRSTGPTGADSRVSGAFFIPRGTPPVAGWPVVSIAHGTVGVANRCGPTWDSRLRGYDKLVRSLLDAGYAVALTDYEGLGDDGAHPYLDAGAAGRNVIDAVRVLHRLSADVDRRWAAVGDSQGGQAAWAAAELAQDYGIGLDLVGAVTLSPPLNITPLAEAGEADALTDDQRTVLPLIVEGALNAGHDLGGVSARLGGVDDDLRARALGCDSAARAQAARHLASVGGLDLSADEWDLLSGVLRQNALPKKPTTVPVLVVNGDRDQMIPAEWTGRAIAQACSFGTGVDHRFEDAGHSDLRIDSRATDWLASRFAGDPVQATCVQEGANR